jgi:hypothetical protein
LPTLEERPTSTNDKGLSLFICRSSHFHDIALGVLPATQLPLHASSGDSLTISCRPATASADVRAPHLRPQS